MSNRKVPCGGFELDESLEIRDGKLSARSALDSLSYNDLKDKPFWTGDAVDTVLLDETELTFKNGVCMFDTALQLTEGDTYIVTYNGVVYECVAWGADVRDDHRVVVGNGKFIGLTNGNGEPFLFVSEGMFTTDTSALVKIVERHQEIHKIDTKYLPSTIPYMVDDKIPSKYVQEQFPNVKDVFGSEIEIGGNYSTLANPYPNKYVLRYLTLEKFNAMIDGTENLPSVCRVANNLASVSGIPDPTREIHVTWVDYSAYGIAGHDLAGVYIILYDAIIHEDTDNPGVVVSEYAMIKVADKPLS